MTTTVTETERDLMNTNQFRLVSIAARERRGGTRDYVFGASVLAIVAFLTTLAVIAATT